MAKSKTSKKSKESSATQMISFTKKNYTFIVAGLLIVLIGLLLMSGGHNAPDEWNEDVIYSFRRITLAPIVIISGLCLVIYAIFLDDEAAA
jgi:hypothetical protein